MKELWTKAEIEERFRWIKRGRLQEWINEGYIKPFKPATQGKAAKFNRENLYQIHLFHHLMKYGGDRYSSADCLQNIEKRRPKYILLTEHEGHVEVESQGHDFCDNAPNYQSDIHKVFLVINIDMVKKEVDKAFG